ncbi:Muscle calcium channel subunit alpha-1 [Diplonema papillatum]|nr:Muscle calcium channel subunit alpha-1 [Diplonema papillatum]
MRENGAAGTDRSSEERDAQVAGNVEHVAGFEKPVSERRGSVPDGEKALTKKLLRQAAERNGEGDLSAESVPTARETQATLRPKATSTPRRDVVYWSEGSEVEENIPCDKDGTPRGPTNRSHLDLPSKPDPQLVTQPVIPRRPNSSDNSSDTSTPLPSTRNPLSPPNFASGTPALNGQVAPLIRPSSEDAPRARLADSPNLWIDIPCDDREFAFSNSNRERDLAAGSLVPSEAVEEEGEDEIQYTRKVLGLAARAVAVQCLNSRFDVASRSCMCLLPESKMRMTANRIVMHPYFSRFILACIVINSITLALDSPDNKDNAVIQEILEESEIFFVVIFTIEAALKISAWSLFGVEGAYLRSAWNVLDGTIVLVGLLDVLLPAVLGVDAANISAIRLLRILRPLRTVSRVKGMRVIIQTLAHSLPMLGDAFLLMLFLILVFAIAGIQLWSDSLHQRCYYSGISPPELYPGDTQPCSTMATGRSCNTDFAYYPPGNTSYGYYTETAPDSNTSLVPVVCEEHYDVYAVEWVNFNHMGSALLFVFKVVSLDDWPDNMWQVQDTYMNIVWIYFVILVLTSSYFAVNLFLAVLSSIFTQQELGMLSDAASSTGLHQGAMNHVVGLFKLSDGNVLSIVPDADVDLKSDDQSDRLTLSNEAESDGGKGGTKMGLSTSHHTPLDARAGSFKLVTPRAASSGPNTYSVILRDRGALVLTGARPSTAQKRPQASSPAPSNIDAGSLNGHTSRINRCPMLSPSVKSISAGECRTLNGGARLNPTHHPLREKLTRSLSALHNDGLIIEVESEGSDAVSQVVIEPPTPAVHKTGGQNRNLGSKQCSLFAPPKPPNEPPASNRVSEDNIDPDFLNGTLTSLTNRAGRSRSPGKDSKDSKHDSSVNTPHLHPMSGTMKSRSKQHLQNAPMGTPDLLHARLSPFDISNASIAQVESEGSDDKSTRSISRQPTTQTIIKMQSSGPIHGRYLSSGGISSHSSKLKHKERICLSGSGRIKGRLDAITEVDSDGSDSNLPSARRTLSKVSCVSKASKGSKGSRASRFKNWTIHMVPYGNTTPASDEEELVESHGLMEAASPCSPRETYGFEDHNLSLSTAPELRKLNSLRARIHSALWVSRGAVPRDEAASEYSPLATQRQQSAHAVAKKLAAAVVAARDVRQTGRVPLNRGRVHRHENSPFADGLSDGKARPMDDECSTTSSSSETSFDPWDFYDNIRNLRNPSGPAAARPNGGSKRGRSVIVGPGFLRQDDDDAPAIRRLRSAPEAGQTSSPSPSATPDQHPYHRRKHGGSTPPAANSGRGTPSADFGAPDEGASVATSRPEMPKLKLLRVKMAEDVSVVPDSNAGDSPRAGSAAGAAAAIAGRPRLGVTWKQRRKTEYFSIYSSSLIPPQWEVAEGSTMGAGAAVCKKHCRVRNPRDIQRCRRYCVDKRYGGFAIRGGYAHFHEETGEEIRLNLAPEQDTVFHLVTLWEEKRGKTGFPHSSVLTLPIDDEHPLDLEHCVHVCMQRGYGGFSVDQVARRIEFKMQRSDRCREALCSSPSHTFYLIKGEVGWRLKVRALVLHPWYEKLLLIVTVVNVAALAADHHNINTSALWAINVINIVCTIIFTIDIVIKVIGLGFVLTLRDPYNVFDALLVVIGIPQLVLTFVAQNSGGNLLSIFRMLRVARVLRLGRRWPRLRHTISIVLESLSAVAYLSLLLLLILFIYSVLGMQMFGETMTSAVSRLTFSSLPRSLLTVFVIVTGEGWVQVMTAAMNASGGAAALYFVSLFVIGRYIIVNLFIAIIIERFEKKRASAKPVDEAARELDYQASETTVDEEEQQDAHCPDGSPREMLQQRRSVFDLKFHPKGNEPQKSGSPRFASPVLGCSTPPKCTRINMPPDDPSISTSGNINRGSSNDAVNSSSNITGAANDPSCAVERSAFNQSNNTVDDFNLDTATNSDPPVTDAPVDPSIFGETTLFCLSTTHPVRVYLTPVITSTTVDKLILFMILANLIVLAAESPVTEERTGNFFYIADFAFTSLFAIEMLSKMAVLGFWNTKVNPYAYLADLWNVIDFVVVATSVLGLFIPFFRLCRSIRVFRLVTRSAHAKVVLYATVGAMPSVLNGLIVCGFVFVLFAILGVQIMKGALVACSNPEITVKEECHGVFIDEFGFERNAEWQFLENGFNHLGVATFTLFKVALSEEWTSIMFSAMDSTDPDTAPRKDARPELSLFFVTFYTIANFLCLNLIISILISTFSTYHEARFITTHEQEDQPWIGGWQADTQRFELMRHKLLTEGQKKWVRSQQLLAQDIHYTSVPKNRYRKKLHKLASSKKFEWFIAGVIVANLVLLCTQHRQEADAYRLAFEAFNYVFISIYTVEFLIKVLGLGWKGYWQDGWNRFDFVVLLVSLVGLGIGESLAMFRVFRIGRLLRLFHMSKGLAKMFAALLYALPPLFNIGLVLSCVFFVFGVMGVDIFGQLDLMSNPALNHNFNFRNLPEAVLLLFQVSTGEYWLQGMRGCRVQEPYCKQPDCGTDFAVPYFISFMIIVSFLMVNLFVAVVLEAFQDAEHVLNNEKLVGSFHEFRRQWLERTYDSEHDNDEMDVDLFIDLINRTPAPLGPKNEASLLKLLKDYNIPVDENMRVHYQDVVHALARTVFMISREQALELNYLSKVRVAEDMFTVAHVWCVRKIARLWREHVERKKKAAEEESHAPQFDRTEKSETAATATPFTAHMDGCEPATPLFLPFTSVQVAIDSKSRDSMHSRRHAPTSEPDGFASLSKSRRRSQLTLALQHKNSELSNHRDTHHATTKSRRSVHSPVPSLGSMRQSGYGSGRDLVAVRHVKSSGTSSANDARHRNATPTSISSGKDKLHNSVHSRYHATHGSLNLLMPTTPITPQTSGLSAPVSPQTPGTPNHFRPIG